MTKREEKKDNTAAETIHARASSQFLINMHTL